MKRVLVLGASGFIGSHIFDLMRSLNYQVIGIGRRRVDREGYYSIDLYSNSGEDALRGLFEQFDPEVVVNCVGGGYVSTKTKSGLKEIVDYNVRVVDLLAGIFEVGFRPEKLVHLGSVSSYGVRLDEEISEDTPKRPKTPHEIAKYEAEVKIKEICNQFAVPWVILQPAQVYGPADVRSDLYRLISFACKYKVLLIVGKGDNYMVPLVYVEDVAKAVESAVRNEVANKEILLAWDRITWNGFAEVLSEIIPGLKVIHFPFFLWKALVYLQESVLTVLGREPLFSSDRLPYLVRNRLYRSKYFELLGFEPIDLETGMRRTLESYGCV